PAATAARGRRIAPESSHLPREFLMQCGIFSARARGVAGLFSAARFAADFRTWSVKMRLFGLVGAAAIALSATPAVAALLVSGDSNIFDHIGSNPANQKFLQNITGGTHIVVLDSNRAFLGFQGTAITSYLNTHGFNATLLSAPTAITAAELSGQNLFIGFAPIDKFTSSETT